MLFDDIPRNDPSPARDREGSFHFLNRVHKPAWHRVRELLEDWYAEYPDSTGDLKTRFRDATGGQHYGAWWELYIYTLYRRLGYEVITHPVVSGTTRRPDFLVSQGDSSLYVECVVFFSGGSSGMRERTEKAWIYDCINQVEDSGFHLDLEFAAIGVERPTVREVARPIRTWLDTLDPDQALAEHRAGAPLPALRVSTRGWELDLEAWPVEPDRREPGGRVLGVYPVEQAFVNRDIERIRKIVAGKGRRYGQLEAPLVVAVLNTSAFVEEDDVTDALFGSTAVEYVEYEPSSVKGVRLRNGYWRGRHSDRGARVSAVLLGQYLHAWNVANTTPTMWINPWANTLIDQCDQFCDSITASDAGQVAKQEHDLVPHALFGLDHDWPGF